MFGELLELSIDRCLSRWREVSRQTKEKFLESGPFPEDSSSSLDSNRAVDHQEAAIRIPLFRMGLPNIEPNRISFEIRNIGFTNEFIGGGRIISVPIPPTGTKFEVSSFLASSSRNPGFSSGFFVSVPIDGFGSVDSSSP